MLNGQDYAGYVTSAVMRAILKNEGVPMSRTTFWRWLKRNPVPCRYVGRTLLVPGLLVLELVKRDKGLA